MSAKAGARDGTLATAVAALAEEVLRIRDALPASAVAGTAVVVLYELLCGACSFPVWDLRYVGASIMLFSFTVSATVCTFDTIVSAPDLLALWRGHLLGVCTTGAAWALWTWRVDTMTSSPQLLGRLALQCSVALAIFYYTVAAIVAFVALERSCTRRALAEGRSNAHVVIEHAVNCTVQVVIFGVLHVAAVSYVFVAAFLPEGVLRSLLTAVILNRARRAGSALRWELYLPRLRTPQPLHSPTRKASLAFRAAKVV